MYIHIHKDLICSACGAMNRTEIITRGANHFSPVYQETVIRCLECGHEKLMYSTSSNSTGAPVSYRVEQTNNKESF